MIDDEEMDEWEGCWACDGEGGYHDCGEDSCCCLDPDEANVLCRECGGSGGWFAKEIRELLQDKR